MTCLVMMIFGVWTLDAIRAKVNGVLDLPTAAVTFMVADANGHLALPAIALWWIVIILAWILFLKWLGTSEGHKVAALIGTSALLAGLVIMSVHYWPKKSATTASVTPAPVAAPAPPAPPVPVTPSTSDAEYAHRQEVFCATTQNKTGDLYKLYCQ